MRLSRLHLLAYGPFSRQTLEFGSESNGVVLVHGANEAGKSSTLQAMADLRFGFEHKSDAGFLHDKPLIGGEFIDAAGQSVALLRRKGRGKTLNLADFGTGDPDTKQAAPAEVELRLGAGLDRNSFQRLFGVDRDRMVKGGQDLFDSDGDIGTALFEASSGSLSVHDILKRLDESARRFYVPRARERGGHINQALRHYKAHKSELQAARTLPRDWRRVHKSHESAAGHLAGLETRYKSLQADRLRLTELRTVWPLLSDLDNHRVELAKLADVPELAASAGEERRAADAGLADARALLQKSLDDIERCLHTLADLPENDPLLDMEESINRAVAAAESLIQKRLDLKTATRAASTAREQLQGAASGIDSSRTAAELLARIPTRSERVRIDDLLEVHDQLTRDLNSLLQDGHTEQQHDVDADLTLPPAAVIAGLRAARADVHKSDSDLQRLDKLPASLRAATRGLCQQLDQLGLPEATSLTTVRPVLDARIDELQSLFEDNRRSQETLVAEARRLDDKFQEQTRRQQELLGQGYVATRDDVQQARHERERHWASIRDILVDTTADVPPVPGTRHELADAYAARVEHADRVVDSLALDTERAAELQQCGQLLAGLQLDQQANRQHLHARQKSGEQQQRQWHEQLQAAGLPPLTPAELRDWQRHWQTAWQADEHIHQLEDELANLQSMQERLGAALHANIIATGLASPAPESSLSVLVTTADEVLATIAGQQTKESELAGKRKERQEQEARRARRERELRDSLQAQASDLNSLHDALLLPPESSAGMARARVQEFDDLAAAQRSLESALQQQSTAENALYMVIDAVEAIRATLGDEPGVEPRTYCDALARRLRQATLREKQRLLEQQKHDSAVAARQAHDMTIERLGRQLQALCRTAGVENADALPAIETRSARKRELQQSIDRLGSQLANASPRTEAELRQRLADKDAAELEVEETEAATAVDALDEQLREARKAEEDARRELAAIDGSDQAARATEAMEQATANMANHLPAWLRSRLAHGLLQEALLRFRERAQAPMLDAASGYFRTMTGGRYTKLLSDETGGTPVLMVQRDNAGPVTVNGLSEGTRDQLYLALRLAAIDVRRGKGDNPATALSLVLDDVLMSSDETRAALALQAIARFATHNRVILFTHHRHIVDLAGQHVAAEHLRQVNMNGNMTAE